MIESFRRKILPFFCLFVISLNFSSAMADNSASIKQVQGDVMKMVKAVNNREVDTAIGYTWPGAVEKLGGTDYIKSGLKVAYKEFDKLRLKFTNITFPKDPKFFKMGKRFFVIVYTDTVISMNVKKQPLKMKSSSFFFGARNSEEESWKYLDGVKINSQSVRTFFPEFPEKYEFPKPVMNPIK